jgi:hypothetical protein
VLSLLTGMVLIRGSGSVGVVFLFNLIPQSSGMESRLSPLSLCFDGRGMRSTGRIFDLGLAASYTLFV